MSNAGRIPRGRRRTLPRSRASPVTLPIAALIVAHLLVLSPAEGADAVVYNADFEAKPGSMFAEWSSSKVTYTSKFLPPWSGTVDAPAVTNVETPNRKRRFLGEFGGPRLDWTARTRVRQTVRLRLDRLPRHREATVSFDLLILKSWDGSSPQYGPDRWSLKVDGGPKLLDTTFSNNPKLGSDKSFQDYPRPRDKPQSGASAKQHLGYTFFGDSTYHLTFTFPHAADSLVLEFSSDLFEGKGLADESWGLDDVRVSLGGVEEAATGDGGGSGDRPVRSDRR